jgi:hypothetical protein
MSHLAETVTQIKDEQTLRDTIIATGATIHEGGVARFYRGQTSGPVDFRVEFPDGYDVGFKRNADGTLSVVCDSEVQKEKTYKGTASDAAKLWGTGFRSLHGQYNASLIESTYRKRGYMVQREQRADGRIAVIATRG